MLVLTRRPGESIVIGENIVITVIEIKGGQVRIGIDAPREIDVYREEIYEQVRQENLAAIANVDEIRKVVQKQPRVESPPESDD
ncbi:MAG: carbon storage regulator CsrA [Acidimicrobiia bacterium]|nr:carbon storage regulator CsrA [Acidimicrobiia bacterium]